jgi:hypothetical protein
MISLIYNVIIFLKMVLELQNKDSIELAIVKISQALFLPSIVLKLININLPKTQNFTGQAFQELVSNDFT